MQVIETDRLVLRRVEPDDAAFMVELMNDPGWLEHIGDRGIRSVEDARTYIRDRLQALYRQFGYGLYLVDLKEPRTPIGLCGLVRRAWLDDADLGFAFLPRYRGRGYAHEAASATLEHARAVLGLRRIAAITSPANSASIRLLERLGLRFERRVTAPAETTETCLFARELP
jgi:RimJ/RimL family protein N-acetyltransferase